MSSSVNVFSSDIVSDIVVKEMPDSNYWENYYLKTVRIILTKDVSELMKLIIEDAKFMDDIIQLAEKCMFYEIENEKFQDDKDNLILNCNDFDECYKKMIDLSIKLLEWKGKNLNENSVGGSKSNYLSTPYLVNLFMCLIQNNCISSKEMQKIVDNLKNIISTNVSRTFITKLNKLIQLSVIKGKEFGLKIIH